MKGCLCLLSVAAVTHKGSKVGLYCEHPSVRELLGGVRRRPGADFCGRFLHLKREEFVSVPDEIRELFSVPDEFSKNFLFLHC